MAQYTVKRYSRMMNGRTVSVRSYTGRKTPKSAPAADAERQRKARLAKSAMKRAHQIQEVRRQAIARRK
jgi:hypothetical protein